MADLCPLVVFILLTRRLVHSVCSFLLLFRVGKSILIIPFAVPLGLTGEIWIGGSSPTFGYVGLEEATAEKFIRDPFGHPEEHVYRTGDIGRWNLKGDVEYMGRYVAYPSSHLQYFIQLDLERTI